MPSSHVNSGVSVRLTVTAAAVSSAALLGASLGPVRDLGTGHVIGIATVLTGVSAATELALAMATKEVAAREAERAAQVMATMMTTKFGAHAIKIYYKVRGLFQSYNAQFGHVVEAKGAGISEVLIQIVRWNLV